MPSDERVAPVMKALAGSRAGFHSAVVSAAGEVEAYLMSHRSAGDGRGKAVSAELGVFGSERIDADRFAALLTEEGPLDEATIAVLRKSLAVLREVASAGDAPYRIDVAPGGDLTGAVDATLADVGSAFGAARVAEMARSGRGATAREDPARGWAFARWNRAEREIAPPLVIEVDGGDLLVAGLGTFLDGRQKLVLVVRGPAPVAPLARLITPGVFVMQTNDTADLVRFAAFEGPGIAALVPEGAALFTHDPARTPRLTITHMPEEPVRRVVGRVSVFLQNEELKQLELLRVAGAEAEALTGQGAGAGTAKAAAPADMLAALLMQQANLTDVGA